jgi:NitT/TauT family transport system substrate-binding protein
MTTTSAKTSGIRTFLLAATLAAAAFVPTAPAAEPDKVTAVFSSALSNGQAWSFYLLGVEKGFFSKRGIEISFSEGQGAGPTVQVVANGGGDFGLGVSSNALINAVGQGAKVKMVATDGPIAAIAVMSKPPKALDKPEDLVGKTIAVPPGTSQALVWPAFLKINGVDPAKVNVVGLQLTAVRAALLQGQIDGYLSYSVTHIPLLKSMGVAEPHALLIGDYGIRMAPDSGVIVRDETIEKDPDLVKRFVAAVTESVEYGMANPKEAAEAGKRAYPVAIKVDVASTQIAYTAELFDKVAQQGKPLTYMNPADWDALVKLLTDIGVAINPGKPTDYYTNEFLP